MGNAENMSESNGEETPSNVNSTSSNDKPIKPFSKDNHCKTNLILNLLHLIQMTIISM